MGRAFIFLTLFFCSSFATADSFVDVRIRVRAPQHVTQFDIYLSGNHPNIGSWRPDAIRLAKTSKNIWQTKIRLPEAKMVEFKFTLGDWDHVEVTGVDKDRSNRFVYCTEDCELNLEIENFRLTPFHARPLTTSGRIEYFHEIYFGPLDNLRSIAVYLPPGYDSSRKSYPVLYALDGQNLFDDATATFGREWNLDETAEWMIKKGEIPPMIIVGIYSTEKRPEELLMNPDYAGFIANGVKPFIEKRFRAKKDRLSNGVLGSSYGGIFAFYTAWKYANYFSKFAAMSTAYWWGDLAVEKMVASSRPNDSPIRLWMDMGTNEGGKFENSVELMKRTYSIIHSNFPGELQAHIIDGGTHNEKAWSERAPRVLKFLFSN
jgi:predicted alpha/beta superfamily hydrolase